MGVAGSLAGAQMQRFEASMGKPTVESGGDSANGVLEKGEAVFDLLGVEGCDAHEHILEHLLANRSLSKEDQAYRVTVDVFGD